MSDPAKAPGPITVETSMPGMLTNVWTGKKIGPSPSNADICSSETVRVRCSYRVPRTSSSSVELKLSFGSNATNRSLSAYANSPLKKEVPATFLPINFGPLSVKASG